ncbi:hypothetical protein [Leptothoe sp. PORK10 BA2]|uniref:hypothetical protein n=1 Tax=Leptothoe sp. PORK10 BA2 TaxID=3110254 RepID=UPI002B207166|nr:hypothetical protein [Leptothoe sp. PORK10 BA2]MEA5462702.1 hypothetical protein [Leptothoe sp. PORK10 BA2]
MNEQETLERLEEVYKEAKRISSTTTSHLILAKTDAMHRRFVQKAKQFIPEGVKFFLKKILTKLYKLK